VPKFFINVEDILSLALGNFEEQHKVLELSIIIINYILIICNAYYNYTV
jgi:hypothetical protein